MFLLLIKKIPKPRELQAEGGTVPLPELLDVPHSRIELMLAAKKLKDKDVLTKSDPLCIVYLMVHRGEYEADYVEIGRTEVVNNNLNPQWNTKIQLDYFFETKQQLRFDIYDIDTSDSKNLSRQDLLGRCETTVSDIVTATDGALTLKLREEPYQKGELIIRAEEVDKGQKEILYLHCHGRQVATPRICSYCCFNVDPYLEFHRLYPDGKQQMVHRTPVVKSADPEFDPIQINIRHLCEGQKDREFVIKCFNYKHTAKPELLGIANLTVNQLIHQKMRSIPLIRKAKELNGSLQIFNAICFREFSWLDFVKGGMQLEFTVSVDFTASNGEVNDPTSRHYIDQYCLNQYELAIKSVLEICEHYNNTKIFEAYGFGAKMRGHWETCHLFPLDINNWQPNVYGMNGVMDVYRNALMQVQLFGPTNFEPTIRHLLAKCRTFPRDGSRYQILLIITDGLITDMDRTKLAIIEASVQPLSIIIIGVGDEDFGKMVELDSDVSMSCLLLLNVYKLSDGLPFSLQESSMLKFNDMVARRDIVQFVPFANYYGAIRSSDIKLTPQEQLNVQVKLAKAVLEEIPYQVTSWCKMHKIQPKNFVQQ